MERNVTAKEWKCSRSGKDRQTERENRGLKPVEGVLHKRDDEK